MEQMHLQVTERARRGSEDGKQTQSNQSQSTYECSLLNREEGVSEIVIGGGPCLPCPEPSRWIPLLHAVTACKCRLCGCSCSRIASKWPSTFPKVLFVVLKQARSRGELVARVTSESAFPLSWNSGRSSETCGFSSIEMRDPLFNATPCFVK